MHHRQKEITLRAIANSVNTFSKSLIPASVLAIEAFYPQVVAREG